MLWYLLGYGIFAKRDIMQGEFLLEYVGELLSSTDGDAIDDQTYIYHFQFGSQFYW